MWLSMCPKAAAPAIHNEGAPAIHNEGAGAGAGARPVPECSTELKTLLDTLGCEQYAEPLARARVCCMAELTATSLLSSRKWECSQGMQTYYCSVLANPLMCSQGMQTYYCSVLANPLMCSQGMQTYYCSVLANPLMCSQGMQTYYCSVLANPLMCSQGMQTYYCSVLANPLMCSQPRSNQRPVLPQSLPQRQWDFSWGGVFCTLVATGQRFRPSHGNGKYDI